MFEWDQNKSDNNKITRGFGFDLIKQFDFATAYISRDEREQYEEPRYRAFGRIDGFGYMVAFTLRNNKIRVISMRRMHEKEAIRYGI